jgi:hypothetical protein
MLLLHYNTGILKENEKYHSNLSRQMPGIMLSSNNLPQPVRLDVAASI